MNVVTKLAGAALLTGGLAIGWTVIANGADNKNSDRGKVISQMYQKLAYQKQMLEALVTEDYESIDKASDALILISRESTWQSIRTPGFQGKAKSFQLAAEDLKAAAKTKDMDRVALPFVRLTLSCVECHELVRKPLRKKSP
jgi:hypothetical protein